MSDVSTPDRARAGNRQEIHPLRCVECKAMSGSGPERWRGVRCDDPEENERPALAFYCPACAEREFGKLR